METHGGSLTLCYHICWNGHEREPESVVVDGGEVSAFFLFATIRDSISEDEHGVRIRRRWSIMTPGTLRLSFQAHLDRDDSPCLFPGVGLRPSGAAQGVAFLGERTTLPASVYVFSEPASVLFFSELPRGPLDAAGIGAHALKTEEGRRLEVELRFPPREEPRAISGPKAEHETQISDADITSEGPLEWEHTVNVVFAPRDKIVLAGAAAAVHRLAVHSAEPRSVPGWRSQLADALETHFLEQGGVAGLREVSGGSRLSSQAGLTLAVLLQQRKDLDDSLCETSLRLADFSLKGQHPSGVFFETYDTSSGEWQGVRGRSCLGFAASHGRGALGRLVRGSSAVALESAPLIPMGDSARIADLLLAFSEALEAKGLPGTRYRLAGERFVEYFLDEKGRVSIPGALHAPGIREPVESGFSGFEYLFPLLRLARLTGSDRHRKAVQAMAAAFSSRAWDAASPPASRVNREPDSRAALLAGRAAAGFALLGRLDVAAETFVSLVIPWIFVNRGVVWEGPETVGGIADSFRRHRLLSCGAETAYVLVSLAGYMEDAADRDTAWNMARLALSVSTQLPAGCGFLHHTQWGPAGTPSIGAMGPVDSRRLTREAEFALRLYSEFPGSSGAGSPTEAAPESEARQYPPVGARAAGARDVRGPLVQQSLLTLQASDLLHILRALHAAQVRA